MSCSTNESELLEQISRPAFLVSDGKITQINQKARQRQVQPDADIAELLCSGQQEYAQFQNGGLCLTVQVDGIVYNASVSKLDGADLFCLESEWSGSELQALAQAAQYLRGPLSNVLLSAEILQDCAPDNVMRSLNHNLHRIHRAICNMADADGYANNRPTKNELRDIPKEISEMIITATTSLEKADYHLKYEQNCRPFTSIIDKEKLERAVLNLISNAIQHGCKDTPVALSLSQNGSQFYISVTNQISEPLELSNMQLFSAYLREPSVFDAHKGIGMGMTIARNTATAHGGALLFDQPDSDTVRFTMSIPINRNCNSQSLHAPVLLPVDYCGGYNHIMTELSEVLPDKLFD